MNKEFRPSITISDEQQRLFMEVLSGYQTYDKLPDNLKSIISKYNYESLIESLNENTPVKPRYSKLMVVVDYINAFVDGSLGSAAAKAIEDDLTERVLSALSDEETAVIFLIDSHYNDEAYLNTREGRHLPVCHANTEHERKLHGKLHDLMANYYNVEAEGYEGDVDKGVWFIEKSQFGYPEMTNCIDGHIEDMIDDVLNAANNTDFDDIKELNCRNGKNDNYFWNTIYETASNLSGVCFIPDRITLVGVATNICVLSNAILLQTEFPQAEIYIPEDSVASYDENLHKAALEVMNGLGMNIC